MVCASISCLPASHSLACLPVFSLSMQVRVFGRVSGVRARVCACACARAAVGACRQVQMCLRVCMLPGASGVCLSLR